MIRNLFILLALVFSTSNLFAQSLELGTVQSTTTLRLYPSADSEKVADIISGTPVKIVTRTPGWVLVEWPQSDKTSKGWISDTKINSGSGPQATQKPATPSPWQASSARDVDEAREADYLASSDPTRSFYFPTALPHKRGKSHARGFYLLGWEIEHQFLDNTSFGLAVAAPIGLLGAGPTFKQSVELAPKLYFAVGGGAGAILSLFSYKHSSWSLAYMAGAMITAGDDKAAVTLGADILGARWENYNSRNTYGHVILADLNAHYRVTKRIKLMLDVVMPTRTDSEFVLGDVTLVNYGIRFGGESLSGDIGFLIPVKEKMANFLKYFPLGIPITSLAFHW